MHIESYKLELQMDMHTMLLYHSSKHIVKRQETNVMNRKTLNIQSQTKSNINICEQRGALKGYA